MLAVVFWQRRAPPTAPRSSVCRPPIPSLHLSPPGRFRQPLSRAAGFRGQSAAGPSSQRSSSSWSSPSRGFSPVKRRAGTCLSIPHPMSFSTTPTPDSARSLSICIMPSSAFPSASNIGPSRKTKSTASSPSASLRHRPENKERPLPPTPPALASQPMIVFSPGKVTIAVRTTKVPSSNPAGGVISVVFVVQTSTASDGSPVGLIKITGAYVGDLPIPKWLVEKRTALDRSHSRRRRAANPHLPARHSRFRFPHAAGHRSDSLRLRGRTLPAELHLRSSPGARQGNPRRGRPLYRGLRSTRLAARSRPN